MTSRVVPHMHAHEIAHMPAPYRATTEMKREMTRPGTQQEYNTPKRRCADEEVVATFTIGAALSAIAGVACFGSTTIKPILFPTRRGVAPVTILN